MQRGAIVRAYWCGREFWEVEDGEIPRMYTNCYGLDPVELRELLVYEPDTGVLRWSGRDSRGGSRTGEPITNSTFRISKSYRNTFGVIYLMMLGRLPAAKMHFRDRRGTNWRWANISPLARGEERPLPPYPQDSAPSRHTPNAWARRWKVPG